MDRKVLEEILGKVKDNSLSIEEGISLALAKDDGFEDLGFAKVDYSREKRVGYPEVIYCQGKTSIQIREIVKNMIEKDDDFNILGTRAEREDYEEVLKVCSEAKYDELSKTITVIRKNEKTESFIAVVTAGTSDIPVAEEAAITAEVFGNKVERIYDVGVAGIHRLFNRLDVIRKAKVIIVIAGMEGALASVVGGLVDKPVIAVPTSVGYGTNFNGLTPLLTMLNSCASGITVVNIDNGFGAAYSASMINKL
ncbi:nickel pincer cofactor biosynthesis protein LarB [uncultured Clostridium sp.]|uniref:nickel pincer cofactor biosynthesis protein LarB n=1 Tax=uncultured Clostridium sp. TaxID=59620 RepID=UPI002602E7B4|nr:nickel pincer cofactor biosynthesis protein LarB [uncultured Clostridium sp.]